MPEINNGPLPEELKGWNWGAFLLNWIWAIGHNVWLGLLCLVPYVGFVMAIVLGLKGNEWAWQYRQFNSVEEYKTIQKAWMKWGIIVFIISIVLGVIGGILGVVGGMMASQMQPPS
jgi:membrane protein YqaA with SNARE-associated domain